jgi:hypothetical protein
VTFGFPARRLRIMSPSRGLGQAMWSWFSGEFAKSSLAEIGWATWGFVPQFVPHTPTQESVQCRPAGLVRSRSGASGRSRVTYPSTTKPCSGPRSAAVRRETPKSSSSRFVARAERGVGAPPVVALVEPLAAPRGGPRSRPFAPPRPTPHQSLVEALHLPSVSLPVAIPTPFKPLKIPAGESGDRPGAVLRRAGGAAGMNDLGRRGGGDRS